MTAPHPLLSLLRATPVAALATVHDGEPFVSMVPFALVPAAGPASASAGVPGQTVLAIHVSQLAQHTGHMLANPAVGLMVVASLSSLPPGASPLALPRLSMQCEARPCAAKAPGHAQARAAYLARFPESEELFGFADFSLFTLAPRQARWVGGFAQAHTFSQPELGQVLSGAV